MLLGTAKRRCGRGVEGGCLLGLLWHLGIPRLLSCFPGSFHCPPLGHLAASLISTDTITAVKVTLASEVKVLRVLGQIRWLPFPHASLITQIFFLHDWFSCWRAVSSSPSSASERSFHQLMNGSRQPLQSFTPLATISGPMQCAFLRIQATVFTATWSFCNRKRLLGRWSRPVLIT